MNTAPPTDTRSAHFTNQRALDLQEARLVPLLFPAMGASSTIATTFYIDLVYGEMERF